MESAGKLFAATLGLTAFALSVASGLMAGAPGEAILTRAIWSMLVCYGVGAVLGMVAGRVITEFIETYRAERPVPDYDAVVRSYMPTVSEEIEQA